jgi:hypothetical protein
MRKPELRNVAAWSIAALAIATSPAWADEERRAVPPNPLYRDECGGCHVAFAPRLLPAESWQRLLSLPASHFGVDASIDAARADELLSWLLAHAATGRRAVAPPRDRITQATWFLREHKEIGAAVWQRASVRQPSNCGACHTRADEGSFREREIAIPR